LFPRSRLRPAAGRIVRFSGSQNATRVFGPPTMSTETHIPHARPVQTAIIPVDGAYPPAIVAEQGRAPQSALVCGKTDGFAIASAVCGITGIVPFVTQILGLICGVVGLARIRRARLRGVPTRGVGWAITGIASSGFVLFCWLAVFVGLSLVSSQFAGTAESLESLLGATR